MREASQGKAAGGRLDHQLVFQNPKAERRGFGCRQHLPHLDRALCWHGERWLSLVRPGPQCPRRAMLLVQLAKRSRHIDAPPPHGRHILDQPSCVEPRLKPLIQPLRHAGRLGHALARSSLNRAVRRQRDTCSIRSPWTMRTATSWVPPRYARSRRGWAIATSILPRT
jgi:hypothetical protein